MAEVRVINEIDPSAQIAPDAEVGRHCVIGPNVMIGPGTVLEDNVTVVGHTSIGSGNLIGAGSILGGTPQDLKYAGGDTLLIIGHRNRLRRRVTAHIGTEVGGYLTRIGDDNYFADDCHIAHDCYVDNHVTLGVNALLAGHIRVESGAVVGADSGVHHFVTIGRYACVGTRTPVKRDVPPYTMFAVHPDKQVPSVQGIHAAGLSAAGLSDEEQTDLRRALADLFEDETALQTKIELLVSLGVEGEVERLCEFCQRSLRGTFGRCREQFRAKLPPEAEQFLTPEQLAEARRALS